MPMVFAPSAPSLFADMSLEDVREYERQMHEKTNIKVCHDQQEHSANPPPSLDGLGTHDKVSVCVDFFLNTFYLSELRPSSLSGPFYL